MVPDASETQGLDGKAFEERHNNTYGCAYQKALMELQRECRSPRCPVFSVFGKKELYRTAQTWDTVHETEICCEKLSFK